MHLNKYFFRQGDYTKFKGLPINAPKQALAPKRVKTLNILLVKSRAFRSKNRIANKREPWTLSKVRCNK